MENKINIAELLKNCPKGMELDCTMYDNVTLNSVENEYHYPIEIETKSGFSTRLTKYGQNVDDKDAKCVIFPKGKTTWEGFQRPFKDGDILYCNANDDGDDDNRYKYVFILREIIENKVIAHCFITGERFVPSNTFLVENSYPIRFATEEEKQKLFQAIKDNGYKWNPEAKTLEKLVEPRFFKVGDRIRHKDSGIYCTLGEYSEGISAYRTNIGLSITHQDLEQWELIPNKFDITTLKPFDKVLIRDNNAQEWFISFLVIIIMN